MGVWEKEVQSLNPTAEPTRDDLMYFAGFYDGEGSASQSGKACIVQIPQKDPEPLYRGRALWGGSLRRPNNRDIWVWVISGDRARLFLQAIYPYVTQRRKEQIEKSGAFNLTGVKCLDEAGTDPERAALRAGMTEKERLAESNKLWYEKNVGNVLTSVSASGVNSNV
jgi:hypothetical protein